MEIEKILIEKKMAFAFILVFITGFLLIWTISPDPRGSQEEMNTISAMDADSSGLIADDDCGSCHEGFDPFRLEMIKPGGNSDTFSEFSITIKNSGTHKVQDIVGQVISPHLSVPDNLSKDLSGSVSRFQGYSNSFPVEPNAVELVVSVTSDGGLLGLNNIELKVQGADGGSWQKDGSTSIELVLRAQDISQGGVGDWDLSLSQLSGIGSSNLNIHIQVNYGMTDLMSETQDLVSGGEGSLDFSLPSHIDLSGATCVISATAYHDHSQASIQDSARYSKEISLETGEVTGVSGSAKISSLLPGQIIGFVSLFLLLGSFFTGMTGRMGKGMRKLLTKKRQISIHCFLSSALVILALIHGIVLVNRFYSIGSPAVLLGMLGTVAFGAISFEGYYRKTLVKRFGAKKWKRIHQIVISVGLVIVIWHMVFYGGHFQWLLG